MSSLIGSVQSVRFDWMRSDHVMRSRPIGSESSRGHPSCLDRRIGKLGREEEAPCQPERLDSLPLLKGLLASPCRSSSLSPSGDLLPPYATSSCALILDGSFSFVCLRDVIKKKDAGFSCSWFVVEVDEECVEGFRDECAEVAGCADWEAGVVEGVQDLSLGTYYGVDRCFLSI